jgi:signal transduction histidine kinase
MKTSTKVIIKFQIFTLFLLFISLWIINLIIFTLWLKQFDKKIANISIKLNHHMPIRWWLGKMFWILYKNCFYIYGEKYCIEKNQKVFLGIYKIKDNYFYVKNNIALDISSFINFHQMLLKFSFIVLFIYILISYPIWRLFLNSIYKKIFQATEELEEKNFIDLEKMNLEKNDELYILFNTINTQIESISSFNKYLSHELKTPLMNISSTIDILKIKEDNPNYDKIKQNIQQIKNIIDSLNKLILIENKKFNLEKTDFDICEEIKKFDINLNLECKTTTIKTNKDLFKIVLNNLLNNAKKYSKWEIKLIVDKDFLEISNLSENIKNIDKLTEKFYKESNKWMWIGLYLVKKIVDILW